MNDGGLANRENDMAVRYLFFGLDKIEKKNLKNK